MFDNGNGNQINAGNGIFSIEQGWQGMSTSESNTHFPSNFLSMVRLYLHLAIRQFFVDGHSQQQGSVRCRYNAVSFLQNHHNRHPIARP